MLTYRQLAASSRFRPQDFLHLRPVYHWTEQRVRGHVAICVYAAVIEALITADLATANLRDPDLDDQPLSAARALRELGRSGLVTLTASDQHFPRPRRTVVSEGRILARPPVDTAGWNHPQLH